MSKKKSEISLARRVFCAGGAGLAVSSPFVLSGCSSDQYASSQSSTVQEASTTDTSTSLSEETNTVSESTTARNFVHPGLLHTQADFDRMAQKVSENASPWIEGWNKLIANSHASLAWTPRPQTYISRGADNNYADNASIFFNDVTAAYACALRWKVSGDTAYADKSIEIMNAWSSTLTTIGGISGNPGNDGFLLAGIQGYQFANAAEIMRTYSGWAATDFARFQNMMQTVFYPVNHSSLPGNLVVYSSWDLCSVASIMAIGVLCDSAAIFNEAINYFKKGLGNGCIAQTVYYIHPGYLGQTQESGRDQGHNTLSISLLATICEMAWNQGVNLYGYDNNRVLAAAEYVAKGNLIESGTAYYAVPFVKYINHNTTDTVFSTAAQGSIRPCWSMIYNHYVNRKGLSAPFCKKFTEKTFPEGGGGDYGPNSGGYDQLGYGTLTFSRDPIAQGAAPSALKATVTNGQVTLSWWGSAYATSYRVKRRAKKGIPYTILSSGITEPRTYTDTPPAQSSNYYVVEAILPSGATMKTSEILVSTATELHTYLTFDENTGTSASDASGNGHVGTLVNGATWATGKKGSAVLLDGTDDYVSLPAGCLADLDDFTISAWVYWQASSTQTWARIFDFGWDTNHYMYLTPKSTSGNAVRFAMSTNGIDGERRITGTAELPYGKWVHVAFTLAGTTGTLYVNGVAVGTNTDMIHSPSRLGNTTQNWLGRSQYASNPFYKGGIDELRIYRGALSSTEIVTLMNA